MKKFPLILLVLIGFLINGCAPKYDYTIHKPKVIYKTPSKYALGKMLPKTHGKRYVWAEEGPRCFDCSGLTYYNYGSMNLWLPRRAEEQARLGTRVALDNLQYGDLIFFDTSGKGRINHVGIYVGNGKFTHASSTKKRVITTSVYKPYYRNRIVVCKRVIPSSPNEHQPFPPRSTVLASNDKAIPKPKSISFESPIVPKPLKLTKANLYTADTILPVENRPQANNSLY